MTQGFEHRTWGSARAVGEKKMEIVSATNVADRNDDGVEITAKRRNKTESRADSRANGSARASLCCAAVSKCIARTEIVENHLCRNYRSARKSCDKT